MNTTVVLYILDEFSYFFKTTFNATNFTSCTLDRPKESNRDGLMYIVNHFLDVDIFSVLILDVVKDSKTNTITGNGSISKQADLCVST